MSRTYRYRWVVLSLGTLAFATSYLARSSHAGIGKYLQRDLNLDKTGFGILSSAFFWAYAFMQVPWGVLTDRLGGRAAIAGGTVIAGLAIAVFAMASDFKSACLSRAAVGAFSASVFVPMAAVCACWFVSRERGLANSVYHGMGAGIGDYTATVLMPKISGHLAEGRSIMGLAGWRGSVLLVAGFILCVGVLCLIGLRSRPAIDETASQQHPVERGAYSEATLQVLRDSSLWLIIGVFIAFTISIRLVTSWVQVYAADVYSAERGLSLKDAVDAAVIVGLGISSGRIVGEPLVGRFSDAILKRGISRGWIMAASLITTACAFLLLLRGIPSQWFFGLIAFSIGAFGNSAPIVSAAVSENYGKELSGVTMGIVNTIGQFSGALTLTASGWIASRLSPEPGNALAEYIPIWWMGVACCMLGVASAVAFALRPQARSLIHQAAHAEGV